MKKILILIILLTNLEVSSQDLKNIEKADTVYIYFKKDKENKQQKIKSTSAIGKNFNQYIFTFSNNQFPIWFSHHYKFSPNEKKKKKSFLKINKDIIIDYKLIEKMGNIKIFELIGGRRKVIYLIDSDEIGWFSIKIKEVNMLGGYKPNME